MTDLQGTIPCTSDSAPLIVFDPVRIRSYDPIKSTNMDLKPVFRSDQRHEHGFDPRSSDPIKGTNMDLTHDLPSRSKARTMDLINDLTIRSSVDLPFDLSIKNVLSPFISAERSAVFAMRFQLANSSVRKVPLRL